MTGWHTQVAGDYAPPRGVIGVVVAPKFPDPNLIRQNIEEGVARVAPETVWVVREKPQKNHAVNVVWETLEAHGIEPVLAPLVPAWQGKRSVEYVECRGKSGRVVLLLRCVKQEYDLRRKWADYELGSTCERVVVFHDASSNVTAGWRDRLCAARVFVVERGKKPAAHRRTGRKPVGV